MLIINRGSQYRRAPNIYTVEILILWFSSTPPHSRVLVQVLHSEFFGALLIILNLFYVGV